MTTKLIGHLLVLLACASSAIGGNFLFQQTVTLYPPRDKVTGKYDEGRAQLSFKNGVRKVASDGQWDLGYGFAAINNEDWFILHNSNENRTVIRDLGEFNWSDPFKVPVLEPLPLLAKGEKRQVTVDASADTGRLWGKTVNIMAKVVGGHLYVMRIKDEETDFYALFRVEVFEQGSYCTISWRIIPAPES
ncbi:MAG: hypothetical protein HY650_13285 [Acidobacteria bacterium]|nr:hypothetical protein [Acidobacteriota bacterium]